jgi:hypothetical protein
MFRVEQEQIMRRTFAVAIVAAGLGVATTPALAHHSFAAEFDSTKPITISGCVTKLEWMNPHARFYLEVKDAAGKVTNWEFELGSPNGLLRAGWTRSSMKIGDDVTVKGFRAKDGTNLVNATSVAMSNGHQVLSGASSGENPATR